MRIPGIIDDEQRRRFHELNALLARAVEDRFSEVIEQHVRFANGAKSLGHAPLRNPLMPANV